MKQFNSIKAAALAASLAATLLFTACGKEGASTTSMSGSKSSSAETPVSKTSASVSTSGEEIEPEITYTMTMYLDSFSKDTPLSPIIDAYNRAHPDQGIEIINPDQLGSFDEYHAYQTYMKGLVESGKGPDILVLGSFSLDEYYNSGYLSPIDDFLASDIINTMIPALIDEGRFDDGLYAVCPYIYSISGMVVSSEYCNKSKWDIEDILNIMAEHPSLDRTCVIQVPKGRIITVNNVPVDTAKYYEPRVTINIYKYNLLEKPFLDTENKKADYYRPEFVALLENIRHDVYSQVKSIDSDKVGSYLAELYDVQNMSDLITLLSKYRRGYNFIGFPGYERGGSEINADSFIAINKNSNSKEAVEDFIEFAVSPEGQLAMGKGTIPGRKDAAEFMINPKKGMENVLGWGVSDTGDPRDFIRLTEFDDTGEFKDLYESYVTNIRSNMYNDYSEVWNLIYMELYSFLESDEDPNAVAKRIQDKVQEKIAITE